jgi:hypothetical protein
MHTITRIGVVSFGKIMGMSGLLMGLIAAVPAGLIIMLGSLFAGAAGGSAESAGVGAMGVGSGLMVMIGVPIVYGVFSFIFGLIYALIINLVLGMAGGLELELHGPK